MLSFSKLALSLATASLHTQKFKTPKHLKNFVRMLSALFEVIILPLQRPDRGSVTKRTPKNNPKNKSPKKTCKKKSLACFSISFLSPLIVPTSTRSCLIKRTHCSFRAQHCSTHSSITSTTTTFLSRNLRSQSCRERRSDIGTEPSRFIFAGHGVEGLTFRISMSLC
jgi:hypothetical protein